MAQMMRADGNQLVGAKADVSSVLGTWRNAQEGTDHITKVIVSEKDGSLLVRLFGAGDGEPVDWGAVEAAPYVANGTTEVPGFYARYELGPVHTELAFNEKQGILVIQTYTSFHDGSGRLPHYSREFFHLSPVLPPLPGADFLLGDWVNTYPDTRWIKGFTVSRRNGTHTVRAYGASEPVDWGEVEISVYEDDKTGDPAFHALYDDLGAFDAALAANAAKGLVVIAGYVRFKEAGQTNYFFREFYYPSRRP